MDLDNGIGSLLTALLMRLKEYRSHIKIQWLGEHAIVIKLTLYKDGNVNHLQRMVSVTELEQMRLDVLRSIADEMVNTLLERRHG